MKRLIAVIMMFAFIFSLSVSDAAVKKVKVKKAVKKIVKQIKVAPKPVIIIVEPLPLPPPPPVVREVVVNPIPRQQGILGWNINTNTKVLYIAGQGAMGALGIQEQIVLDDHLALGVYVGLLPSAVKYGVGIGYVGGKDINDNEIKAIPINADLIVNLPISWTFGIESYVSGGANYVIYGTDETSGNYGAQVALGIVNDYGIGLGKTSVELGWSAVRCGSLNLRSAKGFTLSISQPIVI